MDGGTSVHATNRQPIQARHHASREKGGRAMSVASGIASKLIGTSDFNASVSNRVYEGEIPDNVTTLPACRWFVVSDLPADTLNEDHIDAEVQVDLYGKQSAGSAALDTINQQLFELLHRQAITISGYVGGQAICIDRGGVAPEGVDGFSVTSRYRVVANQ